MGNPGAEGVWDLPIKDKEGLRDHVVRCVSQLGPLWALKSRQLKDAPERHEWER